MSRDITNMKIVMLGEGRVGKTSLLQRFVSDSFEEECESTTKASMYANVTVTVSDGARAKLSIWDTAGQERYHALGPIYYRDAQGAILVYDITDYESFLKVKIWLKELQQVVGNQNISVVVVGNKIDLERQRRVTVKEAEEWANQQNAKHYNVSAKLSLHISEPFNGIATSVFARINEADRILHPQSGKIKDGVKKRNFVGLGPPTQSSRGVKVQLIEKHDDNETFTHKHCSC
ncbi:putative ras-related protein Rab21 [Trypanosoma cruzi]|uniref:Ras-related protein Rab-21 n=2 Tax=Trypanosoma cruzi TaxID=5693 RepID=Q4CRV8_TRYCC|nr:ras-related protein Rab21, putative [Trypanosoma cruzi]EAN83011.1 ras-related protein Rab21, putative [Trypanosoma cruzi]PWV08094.1 putative ras-related protein Rab21 [Trypanosoma cruzi]RNC55809.1 ras-related protein Rab21 [Trypanosoma cruzi]|eukprot:XP_804862.1 ras-related protein Rab21 [Trypanosoma cruzi strain CL Brener]